MTTKTQNESGLRELAEYVSHLTSKASEPHQTQLKNTPYTKPFAFLPGPSGTLKPTDLSQFVREKPLRIAESFDFLDIPSFIQYVNEHKNSHTRIFADMQHRTFKAIIDFHGKDDPNWCSHTAKLILNHSDQFKTWEGQSGKMFSQDAFSEYLKDYRLDIVDPCGSDIAQLVMNLEATASSNAVGKIRTNDGMHLQFQEDVKTNVPIPEIITLALPLFTGAPLTAIQADFKFRIGAGEIRFGYRLLAIDMVLREAMDKITATIAEKTELPVFI